MDAVLQVFRNLGATRLAIIAGVMVATVGFFVWIMARLATPQFALLYTDLEMADSAAVVAELEKNGIPYELKNDGAAIYVPADMVPRTRVRLADQGLPSGGSMGYELFDKADTFGATDFMQNINLVRALEGELARTIRSIDGVQRARVHLVLPKRELFSRQRQEPSASVVLKMRGNQRLSTSQVLAVQNLIASGVPGLVPGHISVIDDKGTLLAGGFEDQDTAAAFNQKAEQHRARVETHLAQTVERLLERTVGPGKVRAEVTADMDFDRINTSEEIYDPDGQVVRSTQTIEEQAANQEGVDDPVVSVEGNLPDAGDTGLGTAGAQFNESRTEETVNYEISKKVINHVREAGIVNRLSVAVLLDGTYVDAGDGTMTYTPRSQDELDLLATLVRGAIGFNAERGDTVEVINMQFADAGPVIEDDATLILGLTKADVFKLAEYLALVVLALLVILLVVRPLMTRALEIMPSSGGDNATALIGPSSDMPALAGSGGNALAALGDVSGGGDGDEMIDLDRVEGRVRASMVKKVGEIVDRHPEEALSILRSWLNEER